MSLQRPLVISRNADYPKPTPRTQREAGIDWREWTERLTPKRSIGEQFCMCVVVALIVIGFALALIGQLQ